MAEALVTNGAFDDAWEWVKELQTDNTVVYSTVLDACAKCGAMDRVPEVFEEMKASCVQPDVITYSTIVKGFCLAGDLPRAFNLLEEMKQDSSGATRPDEIVFNSLLDG